MSDFQKSVNNNLIMPLGSSLYKVSRKDLSNVTYDLSSNKYTYYFGNDMENTIELYSTNDILNYYFGDNLDRVLKEEKIYTITLNMDVDIILYEGVVIGFGASNKRAERAFNKLISPGEVVEFLENNQTASAITGSATTAITGVNEPVGVFSTNFIAYFNSNYHLGNTNTGTGVDSNEFAYAMAALNGIDNFNLSYSGAPILNAYIKLIAFESDENILYNFELNKFQDDINKMGYSYGEVFDCLTPVPFSAWKLLEPFGFKAPKSYQDWLKQFETDNDRSDIKFSNENISIEFDYDKFFRNTNLNENISAGAGAYTDEDVIEFFESTNEIDNSKRIKKIIKGVANAVSTARNTRYDPLILDLDDDGFNVETKENGANFDLDKNGLAEKINWTKKDGILCLDLNGNGKIDNGGEVFGDWTMLPDGARAKNGFEALAQYDSNEDGVIDADDEIFSQLRVWVDADGNGVSGDGELKTLSELGIVSINLGYENVNAETGTEALIGNTATFTRTDGTTGKAGELWVSADLFDTEDRLDVEVSDEIAALPNVKSIGNVYSLHSAVALDETGELRALIESFISEEDADKRIAITEQILFFISGAKNIDPNSRGEYIDARQLAVIEEMLGEKYEGTTGANPHSDSAQMLKSAYQDLLNMYFNELNANAFIKDYAALLRYTENEDGTKTLNADLVNCILKHQIKTGDENAKKMLTEVARYVLYLDNSGIKGIDSFIMNYVAISSEYTAELAKIIKLMPNGYVSDGENLIKGNDSWNFLVGSSNNDKIYDSNGNDVLIGGKGDDKLYGSWDDDTYIFNLGDGNDIIEECVANYSNSRADKVIFGDGISAENIVFNRSGNDLVISYGNNGDTVTVLNQYCKYYEVENFETSDGYSISYTQVDMLIQSMAAFEADTGMSWAEAAEQPTEEYSDIVSQMWVKSVS